MEEDPEATSGLSERQPLSGRLCPGRVVSGGRPRTFHLQNPCDFLSRTVFWMLGKWDKETRSLFLRIPRS